MVLPAISSMSIAWRCSVQVRAELNDMSVVCSRKQNT
jgi:hypothetical protein